MQVLLEAKKLLLWCATPDSVVKLQKTVLLHEEQTMLQTCYFQEQKHDCLSDYLRYKLLEERSEGLFAQVFKSIPTHPLTQKQKKAKRSIVLGGMLFLASLSVPPFINIQRFLLYNLLLLFRGHSGSVVECLTRDQGVAGLSRTDITGFCPLARHINPCLVLVPHTKIRSDITEKLLTGT